MTLLLTASLLLVLSHVVPSAPGIRRSLIASLGRPAFHAIYSALSLAALAFLIEAYRLAEPGPWLYVPPDSARWVTVALMPVAVMLVAGRLTTRADSAEPRGIYRITTVPGSLGVLLWALLHLLNLGEARITVVFLAMTAIALASLVKHRAMLEGAWRERGGVLPFAAILAGRERLVWAEIGWGRPALALALYAALLVLHPYVVGIDPLTGLATG